MKKKRIVSLLTAAFVGVFTLAGCDGNLFLHRHKFTDRLTHASTCLERGYAYEECTVCGERRIVQNLPLSGHTEIDGVVQATCQETGYEYKECTVCGERRKTNDLPKREHSFSDTWSFNETHHWREASCACENKTDYGKHTIGTSNACEVCAFTIAREPGVIYQISDDGKFATVIGYDGVEESVEIAQTYYELPVTAIAERAFAGLTITSVTVPESVTSIAVGAFESCDALTEIAVSESNAVYKSVDGNLYSKDGKTLIRYAIGKQNTSFTIPSGVSTIGERAFYACTRLTSVTIPTAVKTIEKNAFYGCSNLNIYCKMESKPSGWDAKWNPSNLPVEWGYGLFSPDF